MYFRVKFALYFRFFDSWYIIKYLLIETSGKQYVLWTLDCRCFPSASPRETSTISGPQNILFPSVSVNKCLNCFTFGLKLKSMIKQLLNLVYGFLHLKCIIKQLLDSVFVICKIINVSVRVISLAFSSDDNSYLDIDNSAYHKNLIQ